MTTQFKYSHIQNIQYFFACLFFASLNFEVFSPFVQNFSLAKMVAILYIGVSFLTHRSMLLVRNIEMPLLYVWSMFFLMMLSSIIHMMSNSSVFNPTLFLNIIMFWLLLNHHRRDSRVFHQGLLWFSISSFVVGLCYYFNINVSIDEDMRVVVFGENANSLGLKMGVGALFLFNYCLCHSLEKPIYKPWLLIMAVPMVSLLFATASRVSLLVIASGTVLFVLLRQTKKKLTKLLWLVVGLVVLLYGYQIVLQQEVLMKRMERTIDEGSISERDYIWGKYINVVKEHPILGVGFHGADKYAIEVFGKPKSPHNVFLEVALYSGILGLACFLLFIFCVFRNAWLYYKFEKNLGPVICCMAIIGMLMSGQALGVKLFWVLAAYAISHKVFNENGFFVQKSLI